VITEWRKSSRSGPEGGECVELSTNLGKVTRIRDSKNPEGPSLVLGQRGLEALLGRLRS
jgi:hypothetical protein